MIRRKPMPQENFRDEPVSEENFWRAGFDTSFFVPQARLWPMIVRDIEPRPVMTKPYRHHFVPADDPWPDFAMEFTPDPPGLDAERRASNERDAECHRRTQGVILGLARHIVTQEGFAAACERPACRRAGACVSRRPPAERWLFPGPSWPRCANTAQRMDVLRPLVLDSLRRLADAIEARLRPHIGSPWSALDHVGLTALPGLHPPVAIRSAPHPYPLPAGGERGSSTLPPPSPRRSRGEGKGEGGEMPVSSGARKP